nr:MAG TPA: hypothetical protein [Caudoviricetes sp.]
MRLISSRRNGNRSDGKQEQKAERTGRQRCYSIACTINTGLAGTVLQK